MSQHICERCSKNFDSQESLHQHNLAKHQQPEIGQHQPHRKRKIKKHHTAIVGILIILIIGGFYYATSEKTAAYVAGNLTEHVKGSGPIQIIEYSDFQCPVCGTAYPEVKNIIKEVGDKVRIVYKHFPLTSIHPYAFKSAEASECAADQNKFWEYHDKLFENQNKLDIGNLKKYATDIGLDTEKFNSCLDSGAMAGRVDVDKQDGKKINIGGTPTFVIDGKQYPGVLTLSKLKTIANI